jgi:photosynthetic reaction center cytochrome c subunit
MKRRLVAVSAFPFAALVLVAAEKDAGTGHELQNVQVMDEKMRLAEARRYMTTFNEALGVTCRDCHDLRNFASDDNELKLVAREMMRMTKQINEKWFPEAGGEVVTCRTCHGGRRIPAPEGAPAGGLLPPEN